MVVYKNLSFYRVTDLKQKINKLIGEVLRGKIPCKFLVSERADVGLKMVY